MSRRRPRWDRQRRHRRLLAAVVVGLLVAASVGPGTAAASVSGEPRLSVSLPEATVAPGAETTLAFSLANDGRLTDASLTNPVLNERVTAAQGVRVELDAEDAPLTVETGTRLLGTVPDGAVTTVPFDVRVDEDAAPGEYDVVLRVRYSHAATISERTGVVSENDVSRRFHVELTVEPDDVAFRVVEVRSGLRGGETGPLDVTVEHVGDTTARATTVGIRSLDPAVTASATGTESRFVGEWAPGERRTLTYQLGVAGDAADGPYPLELVASYEDASGEAMRAEPLTIGVTPADGERFTVESTTQPVVVGETGAVQVTVRNDATTTARDVTVELRSVSGALVVDGGSAAVGSLGTIDAAGTGTWTFDVRATPAANEGVSTLLATVSYRDASGTTVQERPAPVAVPVAPRLTFTLIDVDASLQVGDRGTIAGQVRNDGDRTAHDAVVTVTGAPAGVLVEVPSYPLGDLPPGATGRFELPVSVRPGITDGVRPVVVTVEYGAADGSPRTSDPLRATVDVAPERDSFSLEPLNDSFEPDSDNRLVVRLTNVDDERWTDVRAQLEPTPPFTSVAPTAYVAALEPGESVLLAFELTVDEDAVTGTDAVVVNLSADGEAGTEREGHLVAVSVAEDRRPTDVAPVAIAVGLALAIAVALGLWWWRR